MLHLKIPRPVFEFANLHAFRARPFVISVVFLHKLFLFQVGEVCRPSNGERSSDGLSLFAPSSLGERPNVTFLLTRLPVGRISVA